VSDPGIVGIRFVLDDRMFMSVASISQDLATLDHVIEKSSMNLRGLREVAEIGAAQDFARYAESTRTMFALLLPQPRLVHALMADAPSTPPGPDIAPWGPASLGLSLVAPGAASTARDLSVPTPAALRAAALQLEEGSQARAGATAGSPVQPHLLTFAEFAPIGRVVGAAPAVETGPIPGGKLPLESLTAGAPAAPLLLPGVLRSPTLSDAGPAAARPTRVSVAPIADAPAAARSMRPAPAEPTLPESQLLGNASAEQSEVTEIHIDGHLLGRFVTDHLARAATRPPAGGTSFDPRRSPAWPGAASGL